MDLFFGVDGQGSGGLENWTTFTDVICVSFLNHIHKKLLRIIYQDYNSSFAEHFRKDSSLTIHRRNLKLLVTEIFKLKIGCISSIMKETFETDNRNCNFRHDFLIQRHNIRSVYYDTKTAAFIDPPKWENLPNSCKDATFLKSSKEHFTRWISENCPCKLCKTYIQCVGFL